MLRIKGDLNQDYNDDIMKNYLDQMFFFAS